MAAEEQRRQKKELCDDVAINRREAPNEVCREVSHASCQQSEAI